MKTNGASVAFSAVLLTGSSLLLASCRPKPARLLPVMDADGRIWNISPEEVIRITPDFANTNLSHVWTKSGMIMRVTEPQRRTLLKKIED